MGARLRLQRRSGTSCTRNLRIRNHISADSGASELSECARRLRYRRREEALRHFLVMTLFAAFAGVVFGAMAKDTTRDRMLYGLKVFAEFMVIGLVLGWILYFIP